MKAWILSTALFLSIFASSASSQVPFFRAEKLTLKDSMSLCADAGVGGLYSLIQFDENNCPPVSTEKSFFTNYHPEWTPEGINAVAHGDGVFGKLILDGQEIFDPASNDCSSAWGKASTGFNHYSTVDAINIHYTSTLGPPIPDRAFIRAKHLFSVDMNAYATAECNPSLPPEALVDCSAAGSAFCNDERSAFLSFDIFIAGKVDLTATITGTIPAGVSFVSEFRLYDSSDGSLIKSGTFGIGEDGENYGLRDVFPKIPLSIGRYLLVTTSKLKTGFSVLSECGELEKGKSINLDFDVFAEFKQKP